MVMMSSLSSFMRAYYFNGPPSHRFVVSWMCGVHAGPALSAATIPAPLPSIVVHLQFLQSQEIISSFPITGMSKQFLKGVKCS